MSYHLIKGQSNDAFLYKMLIINMATPQEVYTHSTIYVCGLGPSLHLSAIPG